MKKLTDKQDGQLIDVGAGHQTQLHEFDVSKSFVYDREYGIFPVMPGHHQQVMALLCAWHHGHDCAYDMLASINAGQKFRKETSYLADMFLEKIPGTAFRSSVGKGVNAGTRSSLTVIEKRIFGVIKYLME